MDRKDIDKSLKWDTEKIYKTDEDFYKDVEEVKKLLEKTKTYKGRILQSADSLYDFLKTSEKLERKFFKLSVYASLKSDEDTRVAKYQEMSKVGDNLFAEIARELSFITPEILSEDYEKVQAYIKEKEELEIYAHYFEDLFRNKEHTLGENEEKIIASFSKLSQNPQNTYMIFSNADLKFPKVKKGDEEIQITDANFTNLELDSNRKFRKEVYEKYYKVYKQFENTAASLLDGEMTANNTIANLKKFDSARKMSLFANNIDEKVYDNLIEVIHDNIKIHRDYTSLRKKVLGLDDLGFYDIYLPLVEDYNKTYTFDEAKELILKALAPLGEDYIKKAREGFDDRWFDVMENEGKRSGGYSSGSYDTEPYILLNYNDSLDSLFTTAHELGHSMHSYYTRKTQPYIYGEYSIFLAEIASTTNELLLLNYMIDHAKDEKEKAYLLNHYVNSFKSTVFRQTMFAEFELEANKLVENSIPVTAEKLNQIYHDLNVDYFGEDIKVDKYISTEWARIPHFYLFYYVFQYATGFSSAVSLSEKIFHGDQKDLEKYLNFLKAGKSKYPIEVLKDAGVDMTKKDSLQKAMDACKEKLEELKKALEK